MLLIGILWQITVSAGALEPVKASWTKSNCLQLIVDQYFTETSIVTIFTNNFSRNGEQLQHLFKSESHMKILRDFDLYKVDFNDLRNKYAILIAEDLQYFILQQKQIEKLTLWNARALYIFYSVSNSKHVLQKFMNMLWDGYIINVIVLMPVDDTDEMNIYSWFPYKGQHCGTNVEAELVASCTKGILKSNTNLFPNKVPLNLHGCPVRIRALIHSPYVFPPENETLEDDKVLSITEGSEVQLILAIANAANFTILFTSSTGSHDWGMATVDGNTSGTIRSLKYKEADIGMGAFGATAERRMYCDYSASHLQAVLAWCVPKAQLAPRWKNMLATFKFHAWIIMIIIYVIVSIIMWCFSLYHPTDHSTFRKVQNCFQYMFASFLGLAANDTPSTISGRILFYIWLIFGFHFAVAFQAKLMGALLRPSYEHQLSTIAQVLDSGMDYELLPTHKRFYSNLNDLQTKKIIRGWTNCNNSDACLKRIIEQRDFAFSTTKKHALFESMKYLDSKGQILIHCIPYLRFSFELYMTKGYPLKARIDELIYRIHNSGLLFKWDRDINIKWRLKYHHDTIALDDVEQVLSILHLQGAFAIWIIGLCISVFVFVLENLYFMIRQLTSS